MLWHSRGIHLGGWGRWVWEWMTRSLRSFQQLPEIPSVQTFNFHLTRSSPPFAVKTTHKSSRNRPDSSQVIIQVILMLTHYTNPVTFLHFVLSWTQNKITRKATAEERSCVILHDIDGGSFHYGQMTPVVKMATPRSLNAVIRVQYITSFAYT